MPFKQSQEEDLALSNMPIQNVDQATSFSASGAFAGTGNQTHIHSAQNNTQSLIHHVLEDMKAEEEVHIDLSGKTSLADTMIIASGRSSRHVSSIAEKVMEALKQSGMNQVRVEGMPACDWVLIDAGDVILHLFRPEVRSFYNLEKMWGADRPYENTSAHSSLTPLQG